MPPHVLIFWITGLGMLGGLFPCIFLRLENWQDESVTPSDVIPVNHIESSLLTFLKPKDKL